MNILWNQNPFMTTLELDDRDMTSLLKSHQVQVYEDVLFDIEDVLHKSPTDSKAIYEIMTSKWEFTSNLDVDSDTIKSLARYADDPHSGDCVCICCSCMRCRLEDHLSINTIEGLGPQAASKVLGAFDLHKNITDALAYLETEREYVKGPSWDRYTLDEFNVHVPRWERERVRAFQWLTTYKNTHGF